MVFKNKEWIPSAIFNLCETLLIIAIVILMKITLLEFLFLFSILTNCKFIFKSRHYNNWQECLIWTLLLFYSIFMLEPISIYLCALSLIFCSYITKKNNSTIDFDVFLKLFMWKGKETKYQDIVEYVKYNSLNNDLIDFESKLQSQDNLLYMIYKYRFKDNLTFKEISERLDLETQRITEKLDKIAFAIRMHCKI